MEKSGETNNAHAGHRDRMKKRFKKTNGIDFAPHELLEMLLYYTIPRANTNETAHLLMRNFDSLPEMFINSSYDDFISVNGIGEKSAVMLSIISAVFKSDDSKPSKKTFLRNPEQRNKYFMKKSSLCACHEEVIMAVCLSEKMQVVRCEILETGTCGKVAVNFAKLVKLVFRSNCERVIIAHNHLNGFAQPSYEDIIETRELSDMLSAIEIKLIDHIIISENEIYSMAEHHDF